MKPDSALFRVNSREVSRRLADATHAITSCERCPRLREYCRTVARVRKRAFRDEVYWGRPVPGYGDPAARLLLVGLAPAAHGANRTGRVFTGDGASGSGDFLMSALHRTGFANIPTSQRADDGLQLRDAYILAAVRCAPPQNKPTPAERDNCLPYLVRELGLLGEVRVIVALGSFAWDGVLAALRRNGLAVPRPKPKFGHGAEAEVGPYTLVGCFHPSQQNTFTGKLTEPMMDAVFQRTRKLAATSADVDVRGSHA
jgi:uracil-DNA glycosylase family 4